MEGSRGACWHGSGKGLHGEWIVRSAIERALRRLGLTGSWGGRGVVGLGVGRWALGVGVYIYTRVRADAGSVVSAVGRDLMNGEEMRM